MDKDVLISNLKRRRFDAVYFATAAEAREYIVAQIKGKTVGFGGSLTVKEMGLPEALANNGNKIFSHWVSRTPEMFEAAANAQVYILGANGVSMDGEIVNIDGYGNRVSGAIFGAHRERVFYVCGINKVAADLPAAIARAKEIAAPLNAKRLSKRTPCAVKGDKCYRCQSPEGICNATVIVSHPTCCPASVVLVGENLGL